MKGLTNQETLKELARLANYTLPTLDGYSEEKAQEAREKANILETALGFFVKRLWSEEGNVDLDYLKDRGYTEQQLRARWFFPLDQEGLHPEAIPHKVNRGRNLASYLSVRDRFNRD